MATPTSSISVPRLLLVWTTVVCVLFVATATSNFSVHYFSSIRVYFFSSIHAYYCSTISVYYFSTIRVHKIVYTEPLL